jgi:hypothetical protein
MQYFGQAKCIYKGSITNMQIVMCGESITVTMKSVYSHILKRKSEYFIQGTTGREGSV